MILICNIYYHPCYLWLYLFFLCCLYRIAHLENNLPIPSKLLPLTRVLYFKEMINAPCQDWSVAVGFLWKLASFRQLFLYIKFVFLGWFLFRSRSSNTAQLQLSHLSSEKDSVEGRVLLRVALWTAWSFLAKSTTNGGAAVGLCCHTVSLSSLWSDILSLLPSWWCDDSGSS